MASEPNSMAQQLKLHVGRGRGRGNRQLRLEPRVGVPGRGQDNQPLQLEPGIRESGRDQDNQPLQVEPGIRERERGQDSQDNAPLQVEPGIRERERGQDSQDNAPLQVEPGIRVRGRGQDNQPLQLEPGIRERGQGQHNAPLQVEPGIRVRGRGQDNQSLKSEPGVRSRGQDNQSLKSEPGIRVASRGQDNQSLKSEPGIRVRSRGQDNQSLQLKPAIRSHRQDNQQFQLKYAIRLREAQGRDNQEFEVKSANRGQAKTVKRSPSAEGLSILTKIPEDEPLKLTEPREIPRGMTRSSNRLKIPGGYLKATDTIPFLADEIYEGQEMVVVAPCVYSPSEIYLSSAADFPKKVDTHIWGMSDAYKSTLRTYIPYNLVAHPDALEKGMFVAVYDTYLNEYFRGRIVAEHVNKHSSERKFAIQHVDLGETVDYEWGRIFFLRDMFSQTPCFAIRCRFKLSHHYDPYHCGSEKWSTRVQNQLLSVLLERPMRVKFHRRVKQQEVDVWEVSIEGFETPHPLFPGKQPIQEEIIKHLTGEYLNYVDEP